MDSAKTRRRSTPRLEREVPTRGRRILRVVKWVGLITLIGVALGAASIAGLFWVYGRDKNLPNYQSLKDYHPDQVTVILDDQGNRVGEIYNERGRRTLVPLDKIAPIVVTAFVSIEDERFWTHAGLDYVGMVRALVKNIKTGKKKEGASTITQQVVKNLILTPHKTVKRKVQEIILARRLEQALTKEEILYIYLNHIYLGNGRYGVQEAARFYFGKDASQLSIGEAAMLAAMPKAPETYNPVDNPAEAKKRQAIVLNKLAELGKIKPEEAQDWINKPIPVARRPFPLLGTAPEWIDLVRKELVAQKGEAAIGKLGARVRTTMDTKIQVAAHEALTKGLRLYDARHKVGQAFRKVKPDKIDSELVKLKKRLPKGGPARGEVYVAVVTEVHDADRELVVDLGGWKAAVVLGGEDEEARYVPLDADGKPKSARQRFAIGDVVEVMLTKSAVKPKHAERLVRLATGPEGAIVVIKLPSREVVALAGGFSSRAADFNRATMAKRQPGSSFKPFVYAAAIDSGRFSPASLVNDAPEVYDLWKPQNYKKDTFEGAVRLRYALAKSINTVAIRICHEVGPDTVANLAARMGIASELPRQLSLALGSGEVTPLEMTNAIATFATAGKYAPPHFIATLDGTPLPAVAPVDALRPEVAYVMIDMMRSVVTEGTGQAAAKLPAQISGKTGTSNDARDAWFIGITPEWAIGVWIGFDDNRPLGNRETGGVTAVPVFVDFMKAIGPSGKRFARPAGVIDARIDKVTGLLSPEGAPEGSAYTEVFIAGTAPTEIAPLPGEVDEKTFVTDAYGDEILADDPAEPATTPP